MTTRIFASPARYIQGADLIDSLGEQLSVLGKSAFIIADDTTWKIAGEKAGAAMKGRIEFYREPFNGEASANEIARLGELAKSKGADLIVGMGGGKAMDTAKGTADDLSLPVAIVPTIASTDAPCSALSVIYTDKGVFEGYRFYKKNPDLVLVDTRICAQAPARLFASGIADGLATNVEAQAVLKSRSNTMVGGAPTIAGVAIAKACEETLLSYGHAAFEAVKQGLVTPAVEAVVEANTLLSGLGFENGGLAAAHAIHNGFTALDGKIHHLTHGEKVAYGTLVQMVLENRAEKQIGEFIRLYRAIGMPVTLKELHLDKASRDDLIKVADLANAESDTLRNLAGDLAADDVADAILAVDTLAKSIG